MRRGPFVPLLAVLTVLLSISVTAPASEAVWKLSIATDRPEAIYKVGEKGCFLVTLKKDGQAATEGEITYVLDKDGVSPLKRGKLKAANGPLVVEGTLEEPGFLRCFVSCSPAGVKKALTATAAAGFDPLKIPPSLPVPDDFDTFWAAQKARLAAVPLKPVLTPVKSTLKGIECFDVQVPCVGPRPVSGYFARPVGAAPRSLPAMLFVHGAGVRSSVLGSAAGAARTNSLGLDINAHGIPNGKPEQYYKDLSAGELKEYRSAGREDREKCYFLGMFLRLVRALDFLTSQPEWDGKVLMVQGSSQGGGQAIAAAGLDSRVTWFAAGVPAICDHSGKAIGRINGWPKLVPDKEGQPDPQILQVARYFDGMNFATRTKAEAIFSVGFIDGTCPPTSIYAAYNNLQGKKEMIVEPLMGHASSPRIQKAFAEAAARHVAKMKGKK
jgi:cephalosporin-C deacetylase-like acetyl esterase